MRRYVVYQRKAQVGKAGRGYSLLSWLARGLAPGEKPSQLADMEENAITRAASSACRTLWAA